MKKIKITLSGMVLAMMAMNSYGQGVWNGSTIHTFTSNHVGIDQASTPTDAWLDIYNPVDHEGNIAGNIPALKISRYFINNAILGSTPNVPANILEIWEQEEGVIIPNHLVDVINPSGYLGVLQANPSQPLDVNGNALIEGNAVITKSLSAAANIGIGMSSAPTDGRLSIHSDLAYGALTGPEIPEIIINRMANTSSVNYFEIIRQPTLGTVGGGVEPPVTMDVINGAGYLGILQPNPSQPLDVAGNGLIEKSLTVRNDATIDQILTVNNYAVIGTTSYSSGTGTGLSIPTGAGTEYSLYVANGILTEKVKVALSGDATNWSDFVFNKDYKLMPLNNVASYVEANKHLPEIPSASEVRKDGIDVASMDAKLLQKIEELTLYVIQQQKQLEQQKSEIDLLKKKMD